MKELEYPFDNGFIMKKKRSLKRQLLGDGAVRLKKRVAVLGGSTTDDIVSVLELFCLTWALNVSSINRNTDSSGRTLCSQMRSLTALNLISFIYTRALETSAFLLAPGRVKRR